MTREQFGAFMFGNVTKLFCGTNPAFFDGSVVEAQVRALDRS